MMTGTLIVLFDESGCVNKYKGMIADRSFAIQWPEVRGITPLGVNGVFQMQVQAVRNN